MLPGIIGSKNEFKKLHELMNYILMNTRKIINIKRQRNFSQKRNKKN